MKAARAWFAVAAVLPTVLSSACASGGSRMAAAVDETVTASPFDQVHWGIHAIDAESGEVLLSRNASRKFVPASNMKILVTAAALHALGAEHRFQTELWAVGRLERSTGVLYGDLVLPGTGDPSLSGRYWDDAAAPLDALADSLVRTGLRRVEGALVVDASRWDSTTVAGTWMVANLPYTYSATGGAFAVGEGETTLVVAGGDRPGVPASVSWMPRGRPGFVVSYLETVAADEGTDVDASYLPESRRLEVRGEVPAGVEDTVSVATRDPVREATAALHRTLREAGIEITDGWRVTWEAGEPLGRNGCASGEVAACDAANRLAGLESPPLAEIAEGILEPSQNWMTEQLVRVLGASDSTRAGWGTGLDAVERILTEQARLDSLDLSLRDGSGLSAYNLVTPRAVVGILQWAGRQPWGERWRSALAEPGEEGSTLSSRLEELEGRLQAKTGTISNVNSLSGYLEADDGRTILFSILTNGSGLPSGPVRGAMDEVVRALAAGGG